MRGVLSLRHEQVRLILDGSEAMSGELVFRTSGRGAFEVMVGVGGHALPRVIPTPAKRRKAVRQQFGRAWFSPEALVGDTGAGSFPSRTGAAGTLGSR